MMKQNLCISFFIIGGVQYTYAASPTFGIYGILIFLGNRTLDRNWETICPLLLLMITIVTNLEALPGNESS